MRSFPPEEEVLKLWAGVELAPRREVPITYGSENQQRLWLSETGRLHSQVLLLKSPHMDLLTDELTYCELQQWDSSSKGARDTCGGTELSGLKARAAGQFSPGHRSWGKPLFLC